MTRKKDESWERGVDRRLDTVDGRLEALDFRFDAFQKEFEVRMDKLYNLVHHIYTMLDKDAARVTDIEVEQGALKSQINRHDRWIQRADKKLGLV